MEFETNNHEEKCRVNSNSLNNSDGFSPEDQSISCVSRTDAMYHKNMDIADIKNSFMEVYRMKINEVECSTVLNKEEQNEKMLHILKTYIGHLEEQNDVLISTVVELEKETQQRVKQMEKRLKTTAKSTMEAVINLHECEELIRSLVTQRLHIESVLYNVQKQVSLLKVENNFLRDQNFNLNHDIQALLHIIHRARSTGNWEMDCMMFCEVTPEQVFGPIQSMSPLYCDSSCLSHLKDNNTEKLSDMKVISTSGSDVNEFRNHHYVEGWSHKDQSLKIKSMDQHNEHHFSKTDEIHIAPQHPLVYCNDCVKPRGGSLPSLDNLILCNNTLQRSYSSKVDGMCEKPDCSLSRLEYLNHVKRKKDNGSQRKRKEKQSRKQPIHKSESNLYIRQAYSEPLLFMYGDGVYVYKPCEAVQKNNYVPPAENLINSLPYQSIDLTLPVEEVIDHDLSACDWDHTHRVQKHSTCTDSFSMPYDKDKVLNCCCSSADFEEMHSSKDFSPRDVQFLTKMQDMCSPYDPNKCTNMTEISNKYNRCPGCHHSSDYNSSFEFRRNDETKFVSVSQYSQTYEVSSCFSIGTQTVANDENSNCLVKISENNCAGDIETQKNLKLLKQNLLKAEDTVHAKEILIEQLHNHLQTAFKEIELKDKALENVERKLDMSRKEKTSLEKKISSLEEETEKLSTALKEAKALRDSILSEMENKNEEIKELNQREQVLQNQKRTLMIQLDTRFDELDTAKTEIFTVTEDLKHCKTQIAQQTHIIQNLQEALVKSKRALDEYVIKSSPSQTLSKTSRSSNSIVNI